MIGSSSLSNKLTIEHTQKHQFLTNPYHSISMIHFWISWMYPPVGGFNCCEQYDPLQFTHDQLVSVELSDQQWCVTQTCHRPATASSVRRSDTTVTQAVRPKTSTRGMVDTSLVTHVAVSKTLHGLEMTYPSIQAWSVHQVFKQTDDRTLAKTSISD